MFTTLLAPCILTVLYSLSHSVRPSSRFRCPLWLPGLLEFMCVWSFVMKFFLQHKYVVSSSTTSHTCFPICYGLFAQKRHRGQRRSVDSPVQRNKRASAVTLRDQNSDGDHQMHSAELRLYIPLLVNIIRVPVLCCSKFI